MATILSRPQCVKLSVVYVPVCIEIIIFFIIFLAFVILFLPQDVSMAYCKRHNSIGNALELPSSL